MTETLARNRDAIAREWLERTLQSYPPETSRFLLEEKDRFRNPAGYALRQGLPVLLDELLGGMDWQKIRSVLDELMHLRAVQDFSPSQAVSFLFLLRPMLCDPAAQERLDQMVLLAFDLYMACREKICEIKWRKAPELRARERARGRQ